MSEGAFLANASVLIQANTKLFRAELASALATVPKVIPIEIVASGRGGQGAAAVQREIAAASTGVSGSSKTATKALRETGDAAEEAGVKVQKLTQEQRAEQDVLRKAATRRSEVTKGIQAQALSAVGLRGAIIGANSAFLAATAGAILFGKAIQSAAQFQTQLAVFAATTGATATQIQAVSDAAKQLGADLTLPGVNAQDAAVAMTELAKAGLSVQDSIDGARGVLQLATAAGIDNAQATELAASALNAFGLAGADASHVADVFANAANDAQGSITDVGIANQQASAAARQAGLSLEQTAGILTIFARNGIKGSDAGTSLRTLLIRLINPTEKANDVIEKLGLHLRDATGGINLGFFDEFARKTANLTAAERDRDAAIIAGQDAFRGLTILSREGGVELSNQIDRLDKQGTAADIAAARTSGLAGAVENLKNQLTTTGLAFGQSLVPGLTGLANLAADAVGEVNNLAQQLSDLRDQAAEPINVVVNFVKGITGQDDPKKAVDDALPTKEDVQGRLRQIFSLRETAPDFIHQVNELGDEAVAALKDSTLGIGVLPLTLDFPTIPEAKKQVEDLIAELNKTPGPVKLNETVAALQTLQAEEAKGTFGTKNFAKSLDPLIRQLQNLSGTKVAIPEIQVPKNLGQVPEEIPKFGSDWSKGFKSGFEQDMQSGNTFTGGFVNGLIRQAFGPAAAAASAAGAATGEAFKAATVAALSDLKLAVAQAGGNQGQELSILRGREAKQSEFLNRLLARPQDAKTVALAQKNAAKLEQTRSAIQQILDAQTAAENKRASDAKTAAQAAQTARDKADQSVLDSFLPSEQRLDIREATAQKSGAPQALIAVEKARKQQLLSEIKQIQDNFNNTQNAKNLIAAKRVQIVNLDAQITSNIKEIFTQGQQARADALQSQVNVAQAEGNIPLQIRLNNVLIAAINKKIASDKLVGKALNDAKAERATLRQANQGLRDQNIQNDIALGQSILDLSGGKNKEPLLEALDAAIANDRARVRALKAAGKSTVVVETELNNFLAQRKEVLKKATDEVKGQGTTAFDLLKEANDTFNRNAGNLINPSQPFAGPTGFTADIAQFLIRRQQPTANVSTAKADFTAPLVSVNSELITVIKENTDALRGKSDKSGPVSSGRTTQHPRVWAADSFWARRFQEG